MQSQPTQRNLADLQKDVEKLRFIDLSEVEVETLIHRLMRVTFGFPMIEMKFPQQEVFRARRFSVLKQRELRLPPCVNVADLWYPPVDCVPHYGRVNRPGKQMFYCAINEASALAEVRPERHDLVAVVRCCLRGDEVPVVICWGLAHYAISEKAGSRMAQEIRRIVGDAENLDKYQVVNSYLDREFTRIVKPGNEHEYKMTVALYELFMQRPKESRFGAVSGIAYQSILWKNGLNLALEPEAVDSIYRPLSCRLLRIKSRKENPLTYEWAPVDDGQIDPESGSINWRSGGRHLVFKF